MESSENDFQRNPCTGTNDPVDNESHFQQAMRSPAVEVLKRPDSCHDPEVSWHKLTTTCRFCVGNDFPAEYMINEQSRLCTYQPIFSRSHLLGCLDIRDRIYPICRQRQVPHRRTGPLGCGIQATSRRQAEPEDAVTRRRDAGQTETAERSAEPNPKAAGTLAGTRVKSGPAFRV